MIAGKYNITVYLNREYAQTFTFDLDISAKVFAGAVDNNGSDVLFSITKLDTYNILLAMDKMTISQFETGIYNYDIKMDEMQIIEGKFIVKPTVTD